MNSRVKSTIATVLVQAALAYALVMALAVTISRDADRRVTTVNVAPPVAPPPPPIPPVVRDAPATHAGPIPARGRPVILHDWTAASPAQREEDFIKAAKWLQDNLSEEERRLAAWRAQLPRGSGPAKVTRLRPPGLATHTLYWPAAWSGGLLPIVAWGNGNCANSSLAYAAFLSEIASHGYFVVAVGNDDIDYPQPEGIAFLADGRPVRTQASALRAAVDWAVAENARGGGPYAGRLDKARIAYMGHDCGASQALQASADPRAATVVLLNAAARFAPTPSLVRKAPLAQFEGAQDDGSVRDAGDANFAKAQAADWPMLKAALAGIGRDGAYPGPNRRWSQAVVAWLDWQLKGDDKAKTALERMLRSGWSRVGTTGLAGPDEPLTAAAAPANPAPLP